MLTVEKLETSTGGCAIEPDPSSHYGLTVTTSLPADAPSKGGLEATVRVAKADLVPTDANLMVEYCDWASLEGACLGSCEEVAARPHRVARRAGRDAARGRCRDGRAAVLVGFTDKLGIGTNFRR